VTEFPRPVKEVQLGEHRRGPPGRAVVGREQCDTDGGTPGPGRREDSRWLFDFGSAGAANFLAVTGSLLVLGVRAGVLHRCPSLGSCAALLHDINDEIRSMLI
jgi:hypothetical protein